MRIRAVDTVELVALSRFDAMMDLAALADANVLNNNCGCRRCVN
jgi:hypothetical protein